MKKSFMLGLKHIMMFDEEDFRLDIWHVTMLDEEEYW